MSSEQTKRIPKLNLHKHLSPYSPFIVESESTCSLVQLFKWPCVSLSRSSKPTSCANVCHHIMEKLLSATLSSQRNVINISAHCWRTQTLITDAKKCCTEKRIWQILKIESLLTVEGYGTRHTRCSFKWLLFLLLWHINKHRRYAADYNQEIKIAIGYVFKNCM